MKKETNYIVEVLDRVTHEVIMEHYTATLEEADAMLLRMGSGEGYFTIVLATPKRTAEIFGW